MRILLIATFIAISLVSGAQPVKVFGKLKVEGTQLKSEGGDSIVLRGMSFGWHNFWPRFYNAGAVEWLAKDWNCSVVRAAMGIEPDGGYLKDPAGATAKVKAVVDAAIKQGVYVIIDWHSHNINTAEAKAFFKDMATAYGAYPNVIYEIFNEPDEESWAEVKKYSEEVIAAIRSVDKDNIILVGSPHWSQDVHLAADDPIKGVNNIMYTLHFYAATHKAGLRDRATAAMKKGLPIFISESAGMEASGDGLINDEEWEEWISWAEGHGVSWITWSVSDKDETCSVLQKTAGSSGGWKMEDLKASGVKARSLLRSFSAKAASASN
ncbi:MAG TPA: glycoside hydrolase family 5 protein [Flavisolibacter sp.]